MADDEPDEELDDEIAALEEEIAALEEGEPDEPADPQSDEGDEDEEGMLGGIVDRFSGEEDDADDEPDEPEDDDEGGVLGGLTDRFGSETEEDEAPQPEPEEDPLVAEEVDETEETDPPEDEPAEHEPRGASGEEATAPEPTPREKARSDRWERTEDGWRRLDPDEVPARAEPEPAPEPEPEPDEEDREGAAALLGRFQGDDPEPEGERLGPPRPEEEEDEGAGILLIGAWILAALIIVALIGGAVVLLGGGGEDVQAAVSSPALEQDGVTVTATGTDIAFDASGSSGPVTSYEWDFGDGETTTTEASSTTHTYSSAGTFTVTVTVIGDGSSSEATLDVRVVEAPEAVPEVRFNGSAVAEPGTVGNNPAIGDTVDLDASGSSADPDEELTTYEWDTNGDGETDATGEQATTSFDEAGAWDVELTVTDSLGNTASQSRAVHVAEAVAFENETIGPAGTGDTSRFHNVSVNVARGGAVPVQVDAELVYGASGDGDLPSADTADLDLNVTTPAGTTYEAEEDDGDGRETLTASGNEIDALGTWAFEVSIDNTTPTGAASETEYTLSVRIVY